jgi:hypothetical protein
MIRLGTSSKAARRVLSSCSGLRVHKCDRIRLSVKFYRRDYAHEVLCVQRLNQNLEVLDAGTHGRLVAGTSGFLSLCSQRVPQQGSESDRVGFTSIRAERCMDPKVRLGIVLQRSEQLGKGLRIRRRKAVPHEHDYIGKSQLSLR